MIKIAIYCCLVIVLISCKSDNKTTISFYHWKNDASLSNYELKKIDSCGVDKIYLRFFDVTLTEDKKVFPVSVLREIDKNFNAYTIVPVVYITNECFKQHLSVDSFANQVEGLINQMFQHHFKTQKLGEIQIDCDWTVETKDDYFKFIHILKKQFNVVSNTIRLHQLKYPTITGIPPVDYGVLMMYNTGDINDSLNNSIINLKEIKQYISDKSSYNIPLKLALPLFSWGVVKKTDGEVKLINNLTHEDLKNDTTCIKIDALNYKVLFDVYIKGVYIPQNAIVRIEEVTPKVLSETKDYLYNLKQLNWEEIIYYHLDEEVIRRFNVNDLK